MTRQDKGKTIKYLIILLSLFFIASYGVKIFTEWGSEGSPTPPGQDFSIFWTASALSLAGEPNAAYDLAKFQAAQQALIGKTTPSRCGWYYPPIFLLMVLPLSLLPYLVSLGCWLGVTLAGYLLVVRGAAPSPLTLWLTLAFPATFWNFFYGQNGFLSAALLGGGLLLLNRSPIWAGLLLGAMCYKPQLAFLIPVALLAGRCWKALMATIASAFLLALISTLVLGPEVWRAFLGDIALHQRLFESGNLIRFQFVPTTFSAAILAGCRLSTAYILQGMVMLAVMVSVIWVWVREGSTAISASVLVLGILLFSHFYCMYDLTLLALPLAWLGWEGYKKGWLPGERIVLTLGWIMPLLIFITWANFQIGPLILAVLLVFALRRYYHRWEFS